MNKFKVGDYVLVYDPNHITYCVRVIFPNTEFNRQTPASFREKELELTRKINITYNYGSN